MDEYLENVLTKILREKNLALLAYADELVEWAGRYEPEINLNEDEAVLLLFYCLGGNSALALDDGDRLFIARFKAEEMLLSDPDSDVEWWAYTGGKVISVRPATLWNVCSTAAYWCRDRIAFYSGKADQAMSDEAFDEARTQMFESEDDKATLNELLGRIRKARKSCIATE